MRPLRFYPTSTDRTKRAMVEFVNVHLPEDDECLYDTIDHLARRCRVRLWQAPEEPDGIGMLRD